MRTHLALIILACLTLAFTAGQHVETYRNHQTGTPAVVIHLGDTETGYSAGWFSCDKGDC